MRKFNLHHGGTHPQHANNTPATEAWKIRGRENRFAKSEKRKANPANKRLQEPAEN
jgi:hypothetical protein